MKKSNIKHYIIVSLILLYLFIPLIGTFMFSIAQRWQATILPEGFTLEWYRNVFSDIRFWEAIGRSFAVSTVSVAFSLIIMVPTVFIITVYYPKLEKLLSLVSMIPFAIPGVVYAVGLLKIYTQEPINIAGTMWILIGAFFIVILPYMFQGIRNCLTAIDAKKLLEAAELLGATKFKAFIYVILPNIIKGITVSALLSFSILFGEFALTNLLVGGSYETVQIYLFTKQNVSGHICSAIVIIYFICVLILSLVTTKVGKLVNKA